MISVDTNILVRVFLEDDQKQYKEAQAADITKNNSLFILSYTVLEVDSSNYTI